MSNENFNSNIKIAIDFLLDCLTLENVEYIHEQIANRIKKEKDNTND